MTNERTPPVRPPLSRPVPVGRLPPGGLDVRLDTTEAERTALAAELGLPSVRVLSATFRLSGDAEAVRVSGRIRATIEQVCVVTLDPFESILDEDVTVDFESPERARSREAPLADIDMERDVPDEIVGGAVDIGLVTQEFLALGLDPHPRKPGVAFESPADAAADEPASAFAALAKWTDRDG